MGTHTSVHIFYIMFEEQKAKITKKIVAEFGGLLDSGLGSDVVIKVGESQDNKEFYVHSFILIAVSPYFQAAFSSTWVNKVDGVILFKKPNVSPEIFEMILKLV